MLNLVKLLPKSKRKLLGLLLLPLFFLFPTLAFAHEQYVLTEHQLDSGFSDRATNVLDSLKNPDNLRIGIFVGIGIAVLIVLYFFFQYSKLGKSLNRKLYQLENSGHFLLRISLAASLLASAYFQAFLGPEIPISTVPFGKFLTPVMFVLGVLLIFGLFTRVVSLLGFLILIASTFVYKDYMITYFNYFGEYLVLIIFGSYFFSGDNQFFGSSKLINKYKDLEILILRVTYGISVLYPAITIKILHPAVIVEIYNQYQLGKIWWLFPPDALLTSLGAGLAQIAVGLFLIFGFETRLAALVTFLLYLGSVIFFQESVWPHIVLLALAFYFVINNGGKYTLDSLIETIFTKKKIAEVVS